MSAALRMARLRNSAANRRTTDRAEKFSNEALRVDNAVGHGATAAAATYNLGLVALQGGELDTAEHLLMFPVFRVAITERLRETVGEDVFEADWMVGSALHVTRDLASRDEALD